MGIIKNNVEIRIFPDVKDLFHFAAEDFYQRAMTTVNDKGEFSVVLAGGATPQLFFDVLTSVERYKKNIPWPNIQFFFGDERYVPADNIESNYHMAYEHLFAKVPINPKNIFRITTENNDPKVAAKEYEQRLKNHWKNDAVPLFDLVYLGLGNDAHTASLMPMSDIVKSYADNSQTKRHHSLVTSLNVSASSIHRITLTPLALNNASNIIFLVTGENKSTAVREVLNGKPDPLHYPAQLIASEYGKTIWFLDKFAAGKLNLMSTHDNARGDLI